MAAADKQAGGPTSDALDRAEAIALCRQLAGVSFPWDITRSLELALLKTFCVPTISVLLVAELLRHGPDSPADFLYVLSTFVAAASLGWQRLRPPRGPRWSGSQRRIGLTGGIASGKSSVAALLGQRGWPVLDADRYAREALAPGSAGERAVLEHWGALVEARPPAPSGPALDRAALGRIVFADAAERRWLEALVHPLVRQRFDAELERLAAEPVVVLMIPLLFEAGLEALCSEVWLVDCDEEQQLQRLMARNGLSEAEARERIAAQWPMARKRSLADRLIDNRGPAEELAAAVKLSP